MRVIEQDTGPLKTRAPWGLSSAPRGRRRGVGFIDEMQAEWNAALEDLRQRERDLDLAEQQLYDSRELAAQDPDDLAQWERLFAKVNAIKSTLAAIHSTVGTVAGWWNDFSDSIPGLRGYKQMGAAQFALPVSIGMITSAAAGIVALVASVSAFVTYLATKNDHLSGLADDVDEMRDAGATETQVAEYVESRVSTAKQKAMEQSGYNPFGDLIKVAGLAVAGIALVVLVPRLLARK